MAGAEYSLHGVFIETWVTSYLAARRQKTLRRLAAPLYLSHHRLRKRKTIGWNTRNATKTQKKTHRKPSGEHKKNIGTQEKQQKTQKGT